MKSNPGQQTNDAQSIEYPHQRGGNETFSGGIGDFTITQGLALELACRSAGQRARINKLDLARIFVGFKPLLDEMLCWTVGRVMKEQLVQNVHVQ